MKTNLPPISLFINYLSSLTDQRGIIEHCLFSTSDLKEGYCLDDNARALQACLRLPQTQQIKNLSSIYLKFILSAKTTDGFHNDLGANYEWKNDSGTHESFGRAMSALGEAASTSTNPQQQLTAAFLFDEMSLLAPKELSARTIAQLVIGFSHRIVLENKFPSLAELLGLRKKLEKKQFPNPTQFNPQKLKELADTLVSIYQKNSDYKKWQWFENTISYDNGRLPFSLLKAYTSTGKEEYKKVALESLDFLLNQTFDEKNNCFSFPGNSGWISREGKRSVFAQQPIEAGSTTEACCLAYQISKKKEYRDFAQKAFFWYFGQNLLHLPLVNQETYGILDGLESWGVNQNQGAESIITFLIGYLAIKETLSLSP